MPWSPLFLRKLVTSSFLPFSTVFLLFSAVGTVQSYTSLVTRGRTRKVSLVVILGF
jgi:hypothetical protein